MKFYLKILSVDDALGVSVNVIQFIPSFTAIKICIILPVFKLREIILILFNGWEVSVNQIM